MKGIPERAGAQIGCWRSRTLIVETVSSSRSSLYDVHKSTSSQAGFQSGISLDPDIFPYYSDTVTSRAAPHLWFLTYLRPVDHHQRSNGRSRAPGSPDRERLLGASEAGSPDRAASAPSGAHEIDQPEARACPRPGSESARADPREAPSTGRWSP